MNLSSGMSADKSADASADVLGRISFRYFTFPQAAFPVDSKLQLT